MHPTGLLLKRKKAIIARLSNAQPLKAQSDEKIKTKKTRPRGKRCALVCLSRQIDLQMNIQTDRWAGGPIDGHVN